MSRVIKFQAFAEGRIWNWEEIRREFDTWTFSGDPIMQFTELYDKNKREVYEGYLLRFPPKDDWEETNFSCFEVFFHDGDGNSDYNIGYSLNRMHNHGAVCGGYIPAFKPKIVSQMIVIGNIYENPELLERKQ
jgi:hypothetical protein